jgi:hypothetical protein
MKKTPGELHYEEAMSLCNKYGATLAGKPQPFNISKDVFLPMKSTCVYKIKFNDNRKLKYIPNVQEIVNYVKTQNFDLDCEVYEISYSEIDQIITISTNRKDAVEALLIITSRSN